MAEQRTVSGACLCGAVRFEIGLPTSFCVHCHCSMCRRAHAAGYVTWVGVPVKRLSFLQGEESLSEYRSSSHGVRRFCSACGSQLFCELANEPGSIDIPLAVLEGEIDRAPQAHIYFDSGAEWAQVDDGLPRLGGPTGSKPLGP